MYCFVTLLFPGCFIFLCLWTENVASALVLFLNKNIPLKCVKFNEHVLPDVQINVFKERSLH